MCRPEVVSCFLFVFGVFFCAAASGPRPDPRPTRDPPATHPASSATIQTIITRPSEALRSSSLVFPIQVDPPGTRETVPEAVAPFFFFALQPLEHRVRQRRKESTESGARARKLAPPAPTLQAARAWAGGRYAGGAPSRGPSTDAQARKRGKPAPPRPRSQNPWRGPLPRRASRAPARNPHKTRGQARPRGATGTAPNHAHRTRRYPARASRQQQPQQRPAQWARRRPVRQPLVPRPHRAGSRAVDAPRRRTETHAAGETKALSSPLGLA